MTRCLQAFLDLPCEWPVQPAQIGLSHDDVFAEEAASFPNYARQSTQSRQTVRDGYEVQLDYIKMCPFFVAVLCVFIPYTGTPPEM